MMSEQQRPPTEEEMRAAYEAELKRVRVDDVLVQTVVSLINLGGRKAGVAPGSEDERDMEQVRKAIEAVRAMLPLVEAELGPDGARVREALSQLQMVYAQEAGGGPAGGGDPSGGTPPPSSPQGGQPGPGQGSSRLWVPGQ
jgi:hypothetical protein